MVKAALPAASVVIAATSIGGAAMVQQQEQLSSEWMRAGQLSIENASTKSLNAIPYVSCPNSWIIVLAAGEAKFTLRAT